jgi:hypothetical protein
MERGKSQREAELQNIFIGSLRGTKSLFIKNLPLPLLGEGDKEDRVNTNYIITC